MKSPEELLAAGEQARRKRDEYQKALSALNHATKRNLWGVFGSFSMAGWLVWMLQRSFVGPDPMTKADGLMIAIYVMLISTQLYLGITQLFLNPKDIALRNLIEEKLKENEN